MRMLLFSFRYCFVLMLLVCCSCGRTDINASVINIVIDDAIVVDDLSAIIENVHVYKMGVSNECFINHISKLQTYQDRIYIKNLKYNVMVFDTTGRCLFAFDHLGDGPDQYSSFADFNVDPWTGNIEVLAHGGVFYVYDQNGVFQSSDRIPMPDEVVTFQRFKRISMNELLLYQWGFNTEIFYIYSFKTKTIISRFLPTKDVARYYNYLPEEISYNINDKYYVFNDQTSKVYHLGDYGVNEVMSFEFSGKALNWTKYQNESHEDEMFTDYTDRMNVVHPILGFSSDYRVFMVNDSDRFRFLLRSDMHENQFLVLSDSIAMDYSFIFYLPFSESIDPDGSLRYYGVITDLSSNLKHFQNLPSVDSVELQILSEFNPGRDNPILFSYNIKKDI